METVLLSAKLRDMSIKAKDLRMENRIPAVFYGKGKKNINLDLQYQEFVRVYKKSGESSLIDLSIDDDKEKMKVLIHDIHLDPVSDRVIHVDFINVDMKKEVHTNIQLEFIGTSNAVKDKSGILTVLKSELEIKCLPDRLISSIEVDISGLEDFHQVIHVKDLLIPEGLDVLDDEEEGVVTVSAPKLQEEDAVADAEAAESEEGVAEGDVEGEEKKEEVAEKEE